MNEQTKYLNCFSVLSFNINNMYLSFSTKNYYFSPKVWTKQSFSVNENNLFFKNLNSLQKKQFWIIKTHNNYNLKQISTINQKLSLLSKNQKLFGPFFEQNIAELVLNTLQD